MTTIVSHYGIHYDADGLAQLVQGRGAANAVGSRKRSPFEVRLPSGEVHCNLHIPFNTPVPHNSHWQWLGQLAGDPLVQAMLPIPKRGNGVYFLPDTRDHGGRLLTVLVLLSKLSSPIDLVVLPFGPQLRWEQALENSNIQPLVVHGIAAKHATTVAEIAERAAASPGTLILVGDEGAAPPQAQRLRTTLLEYDINALAFLPWETLGATVVRKFMRGELELPVPAS